MLRFEKLLFLYVKIMLFDREKVTMRFYTNISETLQDYFLILKGINIY